MRFLLLLLLGTLIFGFAFPAMLLIMGLLGILLIGLIIYRLIKGSSSFTVYTSKDFRRRGADEDEDDEHTFGGRKRVNAGGTRQAQQDQPPRDPSVENIAMDEEDVEEVCEVVELPATALRKDDDAPEETNGTEDTAENIKQGAASEDDAGTPDKDKNAPEQ